MSHQNSKMKCPTANELQAYLSGKSSGLGFSSLDKHIASCPNCQQALGSIGQHSDFITNLIAELVQGQRTGEELRATEKLTMIRDYHILESIGEGGMGCVFRAVHTRLNRAVAIKVLRRDRVNSKEAISRFFREMEVVGKLEHPNIVRALDAGVQDGQQYLVMEYLAGVDVGRILSRMGPLPVSDACQIIRLAASALQYAHDQKILHRDVKPSNLLVTPDGILKLLDLGLAQFCDHSIQTLLSSEDQAIGTLAYMAPEQLSRKEEVTTLADIFSLGVTLHEILTGQRPYVLPGANRLMAELSWIRPDVDDGLSSLITKMVSNQSAERPQSMQEIVDRLTPYSQSSDLATLVAEYFNWRTKKSPALLSVIAPPVFEQSIHANNRNATDSHPQELHGRSISASTVMISVTPDKPTKTFRWTWPVGGIVTISLLALGSWWWADPNGHPDKEIVSPPATITGNVEISPDGEIPAQLLSDGLVIVTNRETGAKHILSNGVNPLAEGTYSITLNGPEDFKSLDDIQIVNGFNCKLNLTTSLTKPFAFPSIPQEPGASALYKGTLWHAGWPGKKEVRFEMRLHVLSLERQEGSPNSVWLKMDTTTHSASGTYSETGFLKIDVDRWRSETFLDVSEGYVRASGDAISQLIRDRVSGDILHGLVVPFAKERDWLREIASDALPEQRLSLHDFIALFFGDSSVRAATETIRVLRPDLLKLGKRNAWIESIQDGFGGRVPCYVASSRMREDDRVTMGYMMASRKAEPFGFVMMEANMPSLKAICAVTISGPAKVDPNELVRAKKDCINPEDWSSHNRFWHLAGLPLKEGETTWHGRIEIADDPEQLVVATARSLGTVTLNSQVYRWIEIEVSSTLARGDNKHWEAARLLVDEVQYRENGKFKAIRGWLSFGDKKTVFSLPENGNLTEIINERMMLFDSPNFERFSVIDAMAMLFDAEFEPPSTMSILRKMIFADRVGKPPKRTSVSMDLSSATPVQGELYESPNEIPVQYKIRRTSQVFFNLVDVTLEQEKRVKISLAIKNPAPANRLPPSSTNPSTLDEWQVETQLRVKESIKHNWRVWTWSHTGKNFKAWAEFNGTAGAGKIDERGKRDVFLKARNGREIRVPCIVLSDEDWNWIPKEEKLRPKGKFIPDEHIQEWLDFAPYIRD